MRHLLAVCVRFAPAAVAVIATVGVSGVARAVERHPADWVRVLEKGPSAEWGEAIDALLSLKRTPSQAIATLVRRVDAMEVDDRRRFSKALYGKVVRPATLEVALDLLGDLDKRTADRAYSAIRSCEESFKRGILVARLDRPHPRRDRLIALLADDWAREEMRRRGIDEIDGVMLLDDIASGRRFGTFDTIEPFLGDPLPAVRAAAVEALLYVGDARVRGAVFPLTRDDDPDVRWQALRVLAWHGDERALEPLLAWADTADDRRWHRNRAFERVGGLYMHTRVEELFELYRQSVTEEQRQDRKALVNGILDLEILADARMMEVFEKHADDLDPFVASVSRKILHWRDTRREASGDGLAATVLVGICLLAGLLGFVLFNWAFRLLSLRRLFHRLSPGPIRSLAPGHVAVAGSARSHGGRLQHPFTGESCLFYPGADRDHPDLRFAIDDGTGHVLVDPRKLVMLTEDGILEEGEKVLLVGAARRRGDEIELAADDSPRSAYQRCVHFVVRHVLGRAARSGSARLLFSDPSRCFCLWDDLRGRPFARWRDSAVTAVAIALTGVWLLIFAVAAVAIVDEDLSATLRQSMEGHWSAPE